MNGSIMPPQKDEPTEILTRKSIDVTTKLLSEISSNITVFRPSKSLSMLSQLEHEVQREASAEIDLVISGGGMKGYFMAGASNILIRELGKWYC